MKRKKMKPKKGKINDVVVRFLSFLSLFFY